MKSTIGVGWLGLLLTGLLAGCGGMGVEPIPDSRSSTTERPLTGTPALPCSVLFEDLAATQANGAAGLRVRTLVEATSLEFKVNGASVQIRTGPYAPGSAVNFTLDQATLLVPPPTPGERRENLLEVIVTRPNAPPCTISARPTVVFEQVEAAKGGTYFYPGSPTVFLSFRTRVGFWRVIYPFPATGSTAFTADARDVTSNPSACDMNWLFLERLPTGFMIQVEQRYSEDEESEAVPLAGPRCPSLLKLGNREWGGDPTGRSWFDPYAGRELVFETRLRKPDGLLSTHDIEVTLEPQERLPRAQDPPRFPEPPPDGPD